MDAADGNYSFNPWMNPEVRPGDNLDPSVWLDPGETIAAIAGQVLPPDPAGITPRLGYPNGEPGIVDVLNTGAFAPLMTDTATRQESGQPGTLGPATGTW